MDGILLFAGSGPAFVAIVSNYIKSNEGVSEKTADLTLKLIGIR